MEIFNETKAKPKFSANQVVIRSTDLKREFCIRITSVLPGSESFRYRGTFTNERGHPVNQIFNENDLKPAE
jgi:hypothetical protein